MPQVQGEITAVRKDRKGIQLDSDVWYSSFNPLPEGIARGVVVSLEFAQKGNFNNIKGVPSVAGGAVAPSPHTASQMGLVSTTTVPHYEKNAGFLTKQFPVPFDHPDRSIIRQNSLTNAVNLLSQFPIADELENADAAVEAAILLASKFEKYSTGDLEREAVEGDSE